MTTGDVSPSYSLSPLLERAFESQGERGGPFHALATEVLLRHVDKGRRGLAVCGAAAGAGVSFVAASLALALAEAGVDTLLVDGNLREPALHELIRPDPPCQSGLLQYLQVGETAREGLTRHHILPDLSLLYAGGREPQPADLFDGVRFRDLIGACMRDHQLTIIDTPPASRCAEARRIASVAGYAVLVGRRGVTFTADLSTLSEELIASGVTLVGSILNGD